MAPNALLTLSIAVSGVAAMASTPTKDYVIVQSEYLAKLEEQLTSAVPTALQPALNDLLNAFDMVDDFELLPHLRLNLGALRLTYAGVLMNFYYPSQLRPEETAAISDVNHQAFAIHTSTGRTNFARQLGLSAASINEIAWAEDKISRVYLTGQGAAALADLASEDISAYCDVINAEFNTLLALGANIGVESAFPSGTMRVWCGLPPSIGFIVLYDWEQHLKDYKAGFLTGVGDMMVKHTILHWDSLFAGQVGPEGLDQVVNLARQSFEQLEQMTTALRAKAT